jgi:dolichol-phosphate mannosyltransferase
MQSGLFAGELRVRAAFLFDRVLALHPGTSGYRCCDIGYLKRAMKAYGGGLVTSKGFECRAEIIAKFSVIGVKAGEYPSVLDYGAKRGKSKMKVAKTVRGCIALRLTDKDDLIVVGTDDPIRPLTLSFLI